MKNITKTPTTHAEFIAACHAHMNLYSGPDAGNAIGQFERRESMKALQAAMRKNYQFVDQFISITGREI